MTTCNVTGLDLDTDVSSPHDSTLTDASDCRNKSKTLAIQELPKGIEALTSLFLDEVRPTGEETEAIKSRLEPIME